MPRTHLIFNPDRDRFRSTRTACGREITERMQLSHLIGEVDCSACDRNYHSWKLQAGAPHPGLPGYHYEEL